MSRIGFRSSADFAEGDYRRIAPRFSGENLEHNLAIADRVRDLALRVVDRPQLFAVELECVYPKYLGREARRLPVTGGMRIPEGTQLVLHALHLPHDLSPVYGASRVTADEKAKVLALFERRIAERIPAAYLTGEAWFAGLSFKSDRRALVPRSPIAELIPHGLTARIEKL